MAPSPKPKTVRDPKYLAWVRCNPCRFEGPGCDYRFAMGKGVEVSHLKGRSNDSYVTPLCPGHHRTNPVSWHNGRETFMAHHGLTFAQLMDEAEQLYAAYKGE